MTAPNRVRRVSPQTDRTQANSKKQTATKAPRVLEKDFQKQVIQLARTCGWLVQHTYGQGSVLGSKAIDPGFPDLILARDGEVIAIELKGTRGRLSDEQRKWLDQFALAEIPTFVWWPEDFEAAQKCLTSSKPHPLPRKPIGGAA